MYQEPSPKKNRLKLILLIVGGVFVVSCALCSVLVYAVSTSHNTNAAPTATTAPTRAAILPTMKPTSIPTKGPAVKPTSKPVTGPAILGANINNFIAKYGQPDKSSQPAQGGYDFGNLSITTAQSKALAILDSAPTDQGWNEDQAKAICLAFAPHDSAYKRQMTLLDGQGNPMALQLVYFSQSLASAFPSSDFTDENSNQTTPGTFGMVLTYVSGSTSTFLNCSAQVGLQGK